MQVVFFTKELQHITSSDGRLPPLEEQRRIVAKVEELAGKIEEARSLREQTIKETKILWQLTAQKLFSELDRTNVQPLKELVNIRGGGTPSKSNPLF